MATRPHITQAEACMRPRIVSARTTLCSSNTEKEPLVVAAPHAFSAGPGEGGDPCGWAAQRHRLAGRQLFLLLQAHLGVHHHRAPPHRQAALVGLCCQGAGLQQACTVCRSLPSLVLGSCCGGSGHSPACRCPTGSGALSVLWIHGPQPSLPMSCALLWPAALSSLSNGASSLYFSSNTKSCFQVWGAMQSARTRFGATWRTSATPSSATPSTATPMPARCAAPVCKLCS